MKPKDILNWLAAQVFLAVWNGVLLLAVLALWPLTKLIEAGARRAAVAGLLLLLALPVVGAEPLSYSLWGKRYFVPVPERQLWSQHEVAMFSMTSPADPSRRWLRGYEFKQARVRGQAGDTNGHNYLVVAIGSGRRILTPTEWKARKPKVGKWVSGKVGGAPVPPKSLALTLPLTHSLTHPPAAPIVLHLSWPDVTGYTPGGWGNGPMVMPDGGPRWWGVYSTDDFRTEQFENRVTEPSCTVTGAVPHRFYVVRWRG